MPIPEPPSPVTARDPHPGPQGSPPAPLAGLWWERGRGLGRSARERSAATVFPDHRKERRPGSCHLSVTQLLTPHRFRLVRGLARQLPAPPSADGQAGRAGRCRADPPSCQLTGAARLAGGRSPAASSPAHARSLSPPVGKSGPLQGPPPPPRPDLLLDPLQAKFLPRAHPRGVSGPAWVRRASAARRGA